MRRFFWWGFFRKTIPTGSYSRFLFSETNGDSIFWNSNFVAHFICLLSHLTLSVTFISTCSLYFSSHFSLMFLSQLSLASILLYFLSSFSLYFLSSFLLYFLSPLFTFHFLCFNSQLSLLFALYFPPLFHEPSSHSIFSQLCLTGFSIYLLFSYSNFSLLSVNFFTPFLSPHSLSTLCISRLSFFPLKWKHKPRMKTDNQMQYWELWKLK